MEGESRDRRRRKEISPAAVRVLLPVRRPGDEGDGEAFLELADLPAHGPPGGDAEFPRRLGEAQGARHSLEGHAGAVSEGEGPGASRHDLKL